MTHPLSQFSVAMYGGAMQNEHPREHEILDMMALIREVVHDYGMATRTHVIKYQGDTSNRHFIRGDRESLRTLLWNLLENVVQSSPAIHEVCVSAWPEEEYVRVIVEECGRSAARRERGMGFLPFLPLEKAPDMLGEPDLNLVSVKIIADAHAAAVTMQGSKGQGSAFVVKFPADME